MSREEKRDVLNRYKRDMGCVFCSERDPIALDFHHLNPKDKVASISQMLSYSWDLIRLEVGKCSVLCSTCHRKVENGNGFNDLIDSAMDWEE